MLLCGSFHRLKRLHAFDFNTAIPGFPSLQLITLPLYSLLYHLYCPFPPVSCSSISTFESLPIFVSKKSMARFVLLFALCVLPALVAASRPVRTPFVVRGKVYCDTCQAGFETSATTYIPGAKVKVECRNRNSMELLYSKEATTDSSGSYTLLVTEDHDDQVCDALLVSSPQKECATASEGRDRARVILTRYNGIASDERFVNAMGFTRNEVMSGCNQVLSQYQDIED